MSKTLRTLSSALWRPQRTLSLPCACRSFSSSPSSPNHSSPTPGAAGPAYFLPKGLVMTGVVTSAGKMTHTTTVTVEHQLTNHITLKVSFFSLLSPAGPHGSARARADTARSRKQEYKVHKKYLVHDPELVTVVGDRVSIRNCKPISRRKRFELLAVLKGARERAENMTGGEAAHSL